MDGMVRVRLAWLTAIGDLEVLADVGTRVFTEHLMTDRHLTSLSLITPAHNHLHVT